MKHLRWIILITLTLVVFVGFASPHNNSNKAKRLRLPDNSSQKEPAAVLPQDRHISARGDFLVSVADIVDSRTGRRTGSRIDRKVIINGVSYKAVVSGRREQMPTKLNIPLQGVIAGDTIILDDSPARILNSADASAAAGDPAKAGKDPVTAEIGGQIVNFASQSDFEKAVNQLILWEMKPGPMQPAYTGSEVGASTWTEGAKTVLFIRVDFSDKPGTPLSASNVPLTDSAAQSIMDNSINPFFMSNSYGKTSMQTTVTPVLRMPRPLSDYVQSYNSGSGGADIFSEARSAAQAAGYNPLAFNLDVIASTYDSRLSFAGLAARGTKGIWLSGYFELPTLARFFGYNFGIQSAATYKVSGGNDPLGPGTTIFDADCYDTMGNPSCFEYQLQRMHFNTFFKKQLDWLTDANAPTISSSGVYRIIAQDSAVPGGIRALRVKRDDAVDYWVELRQLFPGNAANGAQIRRHTFGTPWTELLDMTPATAAPGDETLQIGQTFFDANGGIKITVLGKSNTNPESLDVKVDFNAFASPPPTPANLRSSFISSSRITMQWDAALTPKATSYNLRINGMQVITGFTDLIYQGMNLTQNTSYTFEVQGVNSAGASNWSAPVSVTTSRDVPSPPKNTAATPVSPTQINVFWEQAPANELVTKYNLRINGLKIISNITYLSYAAKDLLPNTKYTFEVQAVNSIGSSSFSTPVSATTPPLLPPTNVEPRPVSATQINLFWNASASADVAGYNLRVNGSTVITGITYLSYAVKNLTPNTTYTFEVQAVTSGGATSGWSSPVQAATLAPAQPAAPNNVVANVVSSSQINVFWNASASPDVTGYNLRVNGSNVITGITYLSYAVKNLMPGTNYIFEVQTVSASGVSGWSAPVQATTVPIAAPNQVTAGAVSQTQINVFWNASASPNIAGYNLRVNGVTVIPGITYLSYAVKNLTANMSYTFEVQAVDAAGAVSNWSAPVNATTLPIAPPPGAPVNVAPQVVSSSQINVFWNGNPAGENVVSYNLRVNGSSPITGITYLSYAVKNLTPNTTYTFEVQAVNSAGIASNWSAPVSATTAPIAPPPNAPANVAASVVSSSQINFFWDASNSPNVTSYNLRVNGSSVITGITYLSYAVKNLTPGTTYTFEVQAVNSAGAVSNWSVPVSATTAGALTAPTIAAAQAVSSSQVNVFWNSPPAGENVTGYNLRVNGGAVISGINYLSYAVKNLNANTTYTFEVQAVGPAGVSNWSAPVNATTPSGSQAQIFPMVDLFTGFDGMHQNDLVISQGNNFSNWSLF